MTDAAASLIARAQQRRKTGDLAGAVSAWREAVRMAPDQAPLWFNLGNALVALGQLDKAEPALRRAIALEPALLPAHFNLGNLLRDVGRLDDAVASFSRCIELEPGFVKAHRNRGNALRGLGRHSEAVASHRAAVQLAPDDADGHYNLANALRDAGELREARAAYDEALRLDTNHVQTRLNLAGLEAQEGQSQSAIQQLQAVLETDPGHAPAAVSLARLLVETNATADAQRMLSEVLVRRPQDSGLLEAQTRLHLRLGQFSEAESLCRRWVQTQPDNATAASLLADALSHQRKVHEAIEIWLSLVRRDPDNAMLHSNLSAALGVTKDLNGAIRHARRALTLAPDNDLVRTNLAYSLQLVGQSAEALELAQALRDRGDRSARPAVFEAVAMSQQGRAVASVEKFEEALRISPDSPAVMTQSLFAHLYSDAHSAQQVAAVHRRHAARIESFVVPGSAPPPVRASGPLRVAYLSPDFGLHPVGMFMEPILEQHDPAVVTSYVYNDRIAVDATTRALKAHAGVWRDCAGFSDAALFDLIRSDGIDILVDLAGMSAGATRVLMLARRPAPLQMLYLGYPHSSGLSCMDYVIADAQVYPDSSRTLFSEAPLYPSPCFLCFKPPADAPPVAPLRAQRDGRVTFGSFNNLTKLTDTTIALWVAVLEAVPGSRLILKASPLSDATTRALTAARFAAAGLSEARLTLLPPTAPLSAHLEDFSRIDISLDPMPFNGGTTTCQGLWMGVPVVTLVGEAFQSRMGLSVLSTVGLDECVAHTSEDYVRICRDLASDLPRLSSMRTSMRERMLRSPLCDAASFTRGLEREFLRVAGRAAEHAPALREAQP